MTAQKHNNDFNRLYLHLYDPVQHDSEENGDDPREDVAHDRGDSSIVTSKFGHHLENVKVGGKKGGHSGQSPGRNSVWEMARLQPERYG